MMDPNKEGSVAMDWEIQALVNDKPAEFEK